MKRTLLSIMALAATLSGCGSGADQPPAPAPAQPVAAQPVAPAAPSVSPAPAPPAAAKPIARHTPAKPKPSVAPRAASAAPKPDRHRAATPRAAPSAAQRRQGTARLVGAVFAQFGLPIASIALSKDAGQVTVSVPAKAGCTATAEDERELLVVLRRLLPDAKTIRVMVAPGKTGLGSYAAGHCRPIAPPAGPGAVVFDRRGAGTIHRMPVTVTAKRWTIAFQNSSASLHVLVRTAGGRAIGAIRTEGRAVGQRSFRGPGQFVLSIRSPAGWRLVVRDGA